MPLRQSAAGALLDVRLSPGAAANRIDGIFIDGEGRPRLKIRVTTVPEKGKANAALLKLLAKSMKCGKGRFEVVAGQLDRNKSILLQGDAAETELELTRWLRAITTEKPEEGTG